MTLRIILVMLLYSDLYGKFDKMLIEKIDNLLFEKIDHSLLKSLAGSLDLTAHDLMACMDLSKHH